MISFILNLYIVFLLGSFISAQSTSYRKNDGFVGPQKNDLYYILETTGNNLIDVCKSVCTVDSNCGYFDVDSDLTHCYLYPTENMLSSIRPSTGSTVYMKDDFKLFEEADIAKCLDDSYTKYSGYSVDSGTGLYTMNIDDGTMLIDACKAACLADPSCVVFDYESAETVCSFYASDAVSQSTESYEAYVKSEGANCHTV